MTSYMRDLRETAEAMIADALGPDAHLFEMWSDAARAASAAARAARAKGKDWKQAGRAAYAVKGAGPTIAAAKAGRVAKKALKDQFYKDMAAAAKPEQVDALYAKKKADTTKMFARAERSRERFKFKTPNKRTNAAIRKAHSGITAGFKYTYGWD